MPGILLNKHVLQGVLMLGVAFALWYAYDTWHNKPVRDLKQQIIDNNATHKDVRDRLIKVINDTSVELSAFHEKYRKCKNALPRETVENVIKMVEEVGYETVDTNRSFNITDFYY